MTKRAHKVARMGFVRARGVVVVAGCGDSANGVARARHCGGLVAGGLHTLSAKWITSHGASE